MNNFYRITLGSRDRSPHENMQTGRIPRWHFVLLRLARFFVGTRKSLLLEWTTPLSADSSTCALVSNSLRDKNLTRSKGYAGLYPPEAIARFLNTKNTKLFCLQDFSSYQDFLRVLESFPPRTRFFVDTEFISDLLKSLKQKPTITKIFVSLRAQKTFRDCQHQLFFVTMDPFSPLVNVLILLWKIGCPYCFVPITTLVTPVNKTGIKRISKPIPPLGWDAITLSAWSNTAYFSRKFDLAVPLRGGLERLEISKIAIAEAATLGLKFTFTGNFQNFSDYVECLKSSKSVINTNLLQHYYGPKQVTSNQYVELTTNRTWEALACGCLLLANRTEILDWAGFHPGVHYLDIGARGEGLAAALGVLVNRPGLAATIASQGRRRFIDRTAYWKLSRYSRYGCAIGEYGNS